MFLLKYLLLRDKSWSIYKWNDMSSRIHFKIFQQGFPGGAVVENPPANAGDTGSSPGLGRSHMPQSD